MDRSAVALVMLLAAASGGAALQLSLGQASANFSDYCMVKGLSRRVAFFHVPKTGTSLGNMIAHYINASLPEEAVVPNCKEENCTHVELTSQGQLEFQFRFPAKIWFNHCLWMKDGHGPGDTDWFSHHQVSDSAYQLFRGRFVGLFRDPQQRAISSFHSFADLRVQKYHIQRQETWARLIAGTATKMLSGQEFPIEAQPFQATRITNLQKPDLEKALWRLDDGFMFVGILERFALSVCLFHTMTKTKCMRHDVDNMRKNKQRKAGELWDTAELNGYEDPHDTPLYKKAKARFWRDVEQFGLTDTHCQKMCPWMDKSAFFDTVGLRKAESPRA